MCIWPCFGSFVPKTLPHYDVKFPWVTKQLNGRKNRATEAAKKKKNCEQLCMIDDDFDDSDCKRLIIED
jgi:hypothetical protein